MEEYNYKRQQQREDAIIAAHYAAAFQRAKKLPKLDKVLEKIRPKEPQRSQTPEQMFAAMLQIHRKMTGEGDGHGRRT